MLIKYLYIFLNISIILNLYCSDEEIHNLVIIGKGPTGLSAAIQAARAQLNPIVIEGKSPSQLEKASQIENWPGIDSIMGVDLSENMYNQAKQLGTQFVKSEVAKVNFLKKPFIIWTTDGQKFRAHCVIIATGSKQGKLNCPGEEKYLNKGIALCATCDGPLFKDKNIILIGGSYEALREALILSKFTDNLTMINKKPKLTGHYSLLKPVLKNEKIKKLNNCEVIEIVGDEKQANGVRIYNKNLGFNKEEIVPADAIFIATRWTPVTELFADQLDLDSKKRIKIKNNTQTSIDGVFAAGDVTDKSYHQAPVAAAFGSMAAMDAEAYHIKNGLN